MNFLLVIVLVIIIIYFAIWLFSSSKTLSNYQKSTSEVIIPVNKLSKPDSKKYGYSFWVYVDSWSSTDNPKCIFYRSVVSTSGTSTYFPSVCLGETDNTLSVTISHDATSSTDFVCVLNNIPIQTWTNITISLNTKILDMYMNGKLVKTCVASFVPRVDATAPITICPTAAAGFSTWDGKVARFMYYSDVISSQEAWNIYKAGPGGNLLSSFLNEYKIKLSFLKGGDEKANITI
jgi:hypothetical protein